MAKQAEAQLSSNIIKNLMAKLPHCEAWKNHGTSMTKAKLDISGFICGIYFELEIKMPGKKPSDRQEARIKHLASNGIIANWATSTAEAVFILDELFMKFCKEIGVNMWEHYGWERKEDGTWTKKQSQ